MRGEFGMSLVEPAQDDVDAGTDSFACPFGLVTQAARPVGQPGRGAKFVQQCLAFPVEPAGFDTFMAGTRLSDPEERRVRFVTPDLAFVITSGRCVLQPGATRCRKEDLSIQTRTAVRQDQDWLFTSFHNSRIAQGGPGPR